MYGLFFFYYLLFIELGISLLILIFWIKTKKKRYGKIFGFFWLAIIVLLILPDLNRQVFSKKILDKEDYYGKYIINREYFSGEQADWQYNHFRFEITDQDSILFYVTDGEKIIQTFRGKIGIVRPYSSARLTIEMQHPSHHIISSNPTIYRSNWSFYMVFHSTKFNNLFFKKGKWKSI